MKNIYLLILMIIYVVWGILPTLEAQESHKYIRIHDNVRETPYPQGEQDLFINPCPLLVPHKEKKSDYLQFELSRYSDFPKGKTISSKPVKWCFFNPHRELECGNWYWRFRSVAKNGKNMPWSDVYSFVVKVDVPTFVTPPFEVFKKNLPKGYPRLYNFFEPDLQKARTNVKSHREYMDMYNRANNGLKQDYKELENPYDKAGEMSRFCNFMYTAYTVTGDEKYKEKILEFARTLLVYPAKDEMFSNDFYCGGLMYLFTHAYDICYEQLTQSERRQIEKILLIIAKKNHSPHDEGYEENHIFDNHFWQSGFREVLQMALILHDKNKEEAEVLEYCYEIWTARAPASGFNRDGIWHNGTGYFETNIKTLCYVPTLFEHYTGFNFFGHPWYKEAGRGLVYTWAPKSMGAGFGDGSQGGTDPGRQRTSFADFLARKVNDPYAAWYAQQCPSYYGDFEQRMYRMIWEHAYNDTVCALPADVPKALWFKDCGEVAMHSNLTGYQNNLALSFRSSPFGSGSHTLADQNSFNLSFRGAPVYRTTGYYLHFSDSHNLLSYRHTRAHNTILVDGKGQPYTTRAFGNVTRMLSGKHISYCVGDASNAYCGFTEYPMWIKNFKEFGVEESEKNGFGYTPLNMYRRHIMMLGSDKVLIYDEMAADEPVTWDWLLQSPVVFDIDKEHNIMATRNEEKRFTAVAQMFCQQKVDFSQTDQFMVRPNMKYNRYNNKLPNQWHLTARFGKSKANRILTLIQICQDGKTRLRIIDKGDSLECGNWVIKAELNADKPASLVVYNKELCSMLNVGNDDFNFNGVNYHRSEPSSLLYDWIDGEWQMQEMKDYKALQTSSSMP